MIRSAPIRLATVRVMSALLLLAASTIAPAADRQPAARHPDQPATVAPDAQDPWAKRHRQVLEESRKHSDAAILFMGDSITAAWANKGSDVWKEAYAPLGALNLAIAGSRTEHVLFQIDQGVLEGHRPKVIVLMIGVNNFYAGDTPEATLRGIRAIIQQTHERLPEARFLLLGVLPPKTGLKNGGGNPGATNRLLAAQRWPDDVQVRYFDMSPAFLDAGGNLLTDLTDGTHPTPHGYRVWDQQMRPVLLEMLDRPPQAPATSQPAK